MKLLDGIIDFLKWLGLLILRIFKLIIEGILLLIIFIFGAIVALISYISIKTQISRQKRRIEQSTKEKNKRGKKNREDKRDGQRIYDVEAEVIDKED